MGSLVVPSRSGVPCHEMSSIFNIDKEVIECDSRSIIVTMDFYEMGFKAFAPRNRLRVSYYNSPMTVKLFWFFVSFWVRVL